LVARKYVLKGSRHQDIAQCVDIMVEVVVGRKRHHWLTMLQRRLVEQKVVGTFVFANRGIGPE
jgi:hypothetical protein